MTLLGGPTKGAQASTESERNVQPWEPFGNFAGRVSFRGALHMAQPGQTAGQQAPPSIHSARRAEIRYSISST